MKTGACARFSKSPRAPVIIRRSPLLPDLMALSIIACRPGFSSPLLSCAEIASRVSWSVITTKRQGCVLLPEGAFVPASITFQMRSSGTGSLFQRRMARCV